MTDITHIQEVRFRGAKCLVWRDDLYELVPGDKAFSGNKARKLFYYLNNDFAGIDTLISYGSAQSNMLYSLSTLAQLKGWNFEFYVDHIPKNLAENPRGNFSLALQNGAKIRESDGKHLQTWVEGVVSDKTGVLFVAEGGRSVHSEPGIRLLANQVAQWVSLASLKKPKLVLPSGTGTTAYFLQKYLPFEVLTCACVGSTDYLRQQFLSLEQEGQKQPTVIEPGKKYHFGKLYPEFLDIWQQLKETAGIEFDLLYDPLGWICMLDYQKQNPDADLIYLHQGGQLGNQTMLERYQRRVRYSQ